MIDIDLFGDTKLNNDCGLVSAAAWRWLTDRGIKAKILNLRYGKHDGHSIVVYESCGRLCTYDAGGSMTYTFPSNWGDRDIWTIRPLTLAKAWCKSVGHGKRPVSADWY